MAEYDVSIPTPWRVGGGRERGLTGNINVGHYRSKFEFSLILCVILAGLQHCLGPMTLDVDCETNCTFLPSLVIECHLVPVC